MIRTAEFVSPKPANGVIWVIILNGLKYGRR